MIEDNIQVLRQVARATSNNVSEKVWCVIAGNDELVDDMAYKAIASKHSIKILFREHVILKENRIDKKFDFIMLNGNSKKIDELKHSCKENGGAFIQISAYCLSKEPNLMVLVAPYNIIRSFVSTIERNKIPFAILLEDQTTGFIEADLSSNIRLPKFLKTVFKPLYNVSDVVLSTILISVEDEKDVTKVQSIATSNKIFVIDFKDIDMED